MPDDHCYRAVSSRDGRFDGAFVTAVTTTRIYCRPSCPAMTPKRAHLRFYPTAAAAQEAGFRACKRCRPDAAPGSPEWDLRADLVARAMRLIGDGVVEREGVSGLAARLGYSPRQLHRLVFAELGTGPLTLARAHRVQQARMLLESTTMAVADVAWAAGFGSVRQFNDSIRRVYALTPTELRRRATAGAAAPAAAAPADGWIPVRLAYRPPLHLPALLDFLARRAVPGVEEVTGGTYRRVVRLPHGLAVVAVDATEPTGPARRRPNPVVSCRLRLDDARDFIPAVARLRRLLDLDADPVAVDGLLGADPWLGPLVAATPGLRVPGAVEGSELALRAVLGQQVSVVGARAVAGRLAARYGQPLAVPVGSLVRAFPTAAAVAAAGPATLPMPAARAAALTGVATAMADGRVAVDPGSDRDRTEADLVGLAGIGPWTAGYIRMRGLGDPDVFLPTDLGVRRALGATGVPEAIDQAREAWHPWCSYVVTHLWNLPHPLTAAATGRPGTPTGSKPRRPLDGRPADSRADRPVRCPPSRPTTRSCSPYEKRPGDDATGPPRTVVATAAGGGGPVRPLLVGRPAAAPRPG